MTSTQLAAIAFVRTSACTVGIPADEFEGEGECPECDKTVVVLLTPLDAETATAECIECGEQFGQDIGN